MTGYLILENGEIFEGERIGYNTDTELELVLNDENFGYIETITDPSYYGQGILFTYPLIGNYGVIEEFGESNNVWASAIFVKEIAEFESSAPSKINFDKYLRIYKVPGLAGLDVEKISNIIMENGNQKAYLTSSLNNIDEILEKIKKYKIEKPALKVCSKQIKVYGRGKYKKIALYDFGFKHSIINELLKRNVEVDVFPANAYAENILSCKPNGIVISNGPGDPEELEYQIKTIKKLMDSQLPILAIGLGHELMGLANGFKIEKMKCGHRGINYVVKDERRNRIYVTAQNHQYTINNKSIDRNIANILYQNIEDNTIEGLIYKNCNAVTVQFEPEAGPGPLDTNFIFDNFIKRI